MWAKSYSFRLRAFLWHVLFSLIIAALSAAVVFWVWHPAPLARAVGVGHIFLMMLAIDVVLGPLLTFAVAKEGKKSLKFDLSVIVLIQIAALVYGLHSIAISRPVFVVFDVWRFEVVQANVLKQDDLKNAAEPYQNISWLQPKWVAVRPAANVEEKNKRLFTELSSGVAPAMQPSLYSSIDEQWQNMVKESKDINELNKLNPPEQVAALLAKYPNADKFIPLKAPKQDMTVLISTKDKQIVELVDLRPWEE